MVINTVGVLVYMVVEAAVAKQKNRWGRVCQTIVFRAGMQLVSGFSEANTILYALC